MDYKLIKISDDLVFIKWYRTPLVGADSEQQFLNDIELHLNQADRPIYFISDLRAGRIVNIDVLRRMAGLATHPNWGGGTSFSDNPLTSIFADVFARFAKRANRQDQIWYSPKEAIKFLETLKPGITEGIDWDRLLFDDDEG